MNKDVDGESRLRRYAQAFRREASPRNDLAGSLMAGIRGGARRGNSSPGRLTSLVMAGGVLLAGLVIAFGVWQLRTLSQKNPTPPIGLTTATPSATPESTPTETPSPTAIPSPTPTPSGAQPGVVPGLAAIQMVGPRLGWAVGSHAIYSTTDGAHWTKQYASSEEFIGVDFISSTTGWAVGVNSLIGTTDGGRNWHQLGEAPQPIRSVHFSSGNRGSGTAGGSLEPGVNWPGAGGIVVMTDDGGRSWKAAKSPADPQAVCFTDGVHGWLATGAGVVYRSVDGGQSWKQSLQMTSPRISPGWARIAVGAVGRVGPGWRRHGPCALRCIRDRRRSALAHRDGGAIHHRE
jgi:hypothetical protein